MHEQMIHFVWKLSGNMVKFYRSLYTGHLGPFLVRQMTYE